MAVDAKTLAIIKSNKLFEHVSESELHLSTSNKDVMICKDGDIIYQVNDSADHIYLLLEGSVKLKHNVAIDGQRIFEKTPGEFFGEKEFMEQQPRSSSAVATKDARLYIFHRKQLHELFNSNRTILNNIQGLEPLKEDRSKVQSSREMYSEEISNLLKTSEQTLEPFSLPEGAGSVTTSEGITSDIPPEDEFPQRFKKTFEESFTFDQAPAKADIEPEPTPEESSTPSGFSWDFASPDEPHPPIEPLAEIQSQPEAQPIDDAPFHISIPDADQEQEIKPESDPGTFKWNFDTEFKPEPPDETDWGKKIEPPSEDTIQWNFAQETTSAEELISEDKKTGDWFTQSVEDEEPIREFEFDEFGNLLPQKGSQPESIPPAEPPIQRFDGIKNPTVVEDEESSLRAQILETELRGEKFADDDSQNKPRSNFGSDGFNYTAPLEAKSKNKTVQPVKVKAEFTKEQLHLIINAAQLVNSNIKLDEVLSSIVEAATALTNADRGTLYIVDHSAGEVWSKIIRGKEIQEIRLRFGQGLAGWVAQTGETLNIKDVTKDDRFDRNIDKVSGYKTKNMLCYPIKNKAGIILAVIQLLNSKFGQFSDTDEQFLEALSAHIAIALENAELVEQLVKTDRLISLGKVAKFLISDIKKPILTIKQLAEHIRKKDLSPEINQVVALVIEQSNIVVDLVLTTLSYSEGKTILNKKVLPLHRVLDDILSLVAEYLEQRKVKLFKQFGEDVLVNIDKREMYQAFFQISKNACEAMPQGGELYVTARMNDKNNAVLISFRDTGQGIDESIKDKVFEPFMSHGKAHGVGLGLSITEKIVNDHDGKVWAESIPGHGATITIELPYIKQF